MPQPVCPTCKEPMQQGFILDHGHLNARSVVQWVKGEPVKQFWKGVKAEVRRDVVAFRCPNCGLLQQYALW